MAVSKEEVRHVARLARLRLTEEETERLTAELNDILSHVETLNTLAVEGIEGVEAATEWKAPLRSEDAAPDALALPVAVIAPAWQDGFFAVPRLAALDTAELEEPFEDKAAAEPARRDTGDPA